MSKKEDFKRFIQDKPELVEYIKNKDITMQGLYEIYDIYGESEEAWRPYLEKKEVSGRKIKDIVQNIDLDEIQKHINTAQKALGVVGELTSKGEESLANLVKGPLSSRPLNKFFED